MRRARGKRGERGYALLMVFLMAAVVGLYLYTQLPRVAFESERDKEQTLIDRGEQYKRAIQLYVKAFNKFPQKIEDLENTNEKRYLRRRYVDPMTGKDEWRLIHVNAGGQLTDSLVQAPPCGALASGSSGAPGSASATAPPAGSTGYGTSGSTTGSTPGSTTGSTPGSTTGSTPGSTAGGCTPANGTGTGTAAVAGGGTATPGATAAGPAAPTDPNDVNAAVRRRPSDVVGQAYATGTAVDPNDPSTWAPITLAAPGANGAPNGQPPSGAVGFNGGLLGQPIAGQVGQNGQPGGPVQGTGVGFPLPGQPGFNPMQNQFRVDANGQLIPVTPPQPGQVNPNPVQTGQAAQPYVQAPQPGQAVGASPFGPQAGGGSNAVNPGTGVAPQNAATSAINQQLTNPNAAQGLGTAAGMTTGGIAGVASMYKGPSIKIYGTRQKYQEWEFIFSVNSQQQGVKQNNPLGGTQPGTTGPGTTGQNGSVGTGASAPGSTTGSSPTGN
jgi:hypothetical protein